MKRTFLASLLLAGIVLPTLAIGQTESRQQAQDKQTQALVTAQLHKKSNFSAVNAKVDEGIVTISGEVPLYIDKLNAEKRVRKVNNVDGVRNHIQVGGPTVSDSEVRDGLAGKLRYDRIGYGLVFNNLAIAVENGTVTVGGNVRDYASRDSALAVVSTTAGVKDVIDEIDVAPVSFNDDLLRLKLARAIYGDSVLRKYALDPQAPIRIVVENGNVELSGVVLNELDRQVANMQANSIPGVFSVTNHLAVATGAAE